MRIAPRRASGNKATITMLLVNIQSAGSHRLWGAPSRHDMSRANENVFTTSEIAIRTMTMA
jgi:hypothetical protein